jgi:hypothetical protein
MSVELRWAVQGHCECGIPHDIGYQSECIHDLECDWGVIEHSDPRPDRGHVGHLVLVPGWWAGSILRTGPHYDPKYGTTTVTTQDDRLFIHMDWEGKRWTWELFEAHFSDGKGPDNMLIGMWPD